MEADFILELVEGTGNGKLFAEQMAAKTPATPFDKMGGECINHALLYLVAAMLKQENLLQVRFQGNHLLNFLLIPYFEKNVCFVLSVLASSLPFGIQMGCI